MVFYVLKIFDNVGMKHVYDSQTTCEKSVLKESLIPKHEKNWKHYIMTKLKLRYYRAFKNTFKTENYLNMNLTCFERSHLAQLRLRILPLMIELGRFRNNNRKKTLYRL